MPPSTDARPRRHVQDERRRCRDIPRMQPATPKSPTRWRISWAATANRGNQSERHTRQKQPAGNENGRSSRVMNGCPQ